jgi:hypothetical protein
VHLPGKPHHLVRANGGLEAAIAAPTRHYRPLHRDSKRPFFFFPAVSSSSFSFHWFDVIEGGGSGTGQLMTLGAFLRSVDEQV